MAGRVVSGAYEGSAIRVSFSGPILVKSFSDDIPLNRHTIRDYQIVGVSEKRSGSLFRAAVGTAIAGPVGAIAGVVGGKHAIYQLAITFSTGARSLLEVDDEIYRAIVKEMF